MSLLDALLLEGDRDPHEVWIALRTDAIKGTGTQADLFDGGTRQETPLPVSSITIPTGTGADKREATATCPASHNYRVGDFVTIAGVTGTDASIYNGSFRIYSVAPTTFKYYMNAEAAGDAQGSSIARAKAFYSLDEVMYLLPANTTVHLGEGAFETLGFGVDDHTGQVVGWQIRSGQRFLGSGIDITILKVVNAVSKRFLTVAVGNYVLTNFVDGFEAADFTVDCNMAARRR